MSRKLSLTLFIIALISMGLVILTGINNAKWDKSASYGQYYFDSLKNDLNEISLIRLSQSGEVFEIKKENCLRDKVSLTNYYKGTQYTLNCLQNATLQGSVYS